MSPETACRCTACGAPAPTTIFALHDLPVLVCVLWPDPESARTCARGDIVLTHCETCGAIENQSFDPERVVYTADYENSLHFSELFQGYVRDLAGRIVERFSPAGGTVVEIGSGDGQFLELLCDLGQCQGVGYDPSYDLDKPDQLADGRVRFVREYFDESCGHVNADLVVCRQVLEHVPDPGDMLRKVRAAMRPDAAVVFEVPNALHMLEGPWPLEVFYEHVTYWSAGSLARLFTSCGYDVIGSEPTYSDLFVTVDARPSAQAVGSIEVEVDTVEQLAAEAARFAASWRDPLDHWSAELERCNAAGRRVALWGTGARGVTFLNVVDSECTIESVIDINPRKHGKYTPGTGHLISAPESLKATPPDLVIVMNVVYLEEIKASLRELGLDPEVRSV